MGVAKSGEDERLILTSTCKNFFRTGLLFSLGLERIWPWTAEIPERLEEQSGCVTERDFLVSVPQNGDVVVAMTVLCSSDSTDVRENRLVRFAG